MNEKSPETELLLLAILPRGSATSPATLYTWPGVYTPAIQDMNGWLSKVAQEREGVHFLDCGPKLLTDGTVRFETKALLLQAAPPSCQLMVLFSTCPGEGHLYSI